MEKNWLRTEPLKEGAKLLCIATFLPVRRWGHVIPFMRMSLRIEKQVRQSPGLVRYGLRTNLPKKRFWTLSVWDDRKAMSAFISREPHATAVKKFEGWAGAGAAFAEWEETRTDFPWDVAFEKLTHPAFYYEPQ